MMSRYLYLARNVKHPLQACAVPGSGWTLPGRRPSTDSITDAVARAAISTRHDSIPA
jgi:hypothetical protein